MDIDNAMGIIYILSECLIFALGVIAGYRR